MGINGWTVAVTVFVLTGFGVLLGVSPVAYGYILMEDSPVEWLGFYCMTAAAFAFLSAASQRRGQLCGAAACAGLGLLCAFVAGEEISWGQRLLGFVPPGFFAHRNVQREVTIHNLAVWWMRPRTIALAFIVLYGGLFPALHRHLRRMGIPSPPWGAVLALCAVLGLFTTPITQNDDEVGELLFALAMLAAGVDATGRHGRDGGRFLARFLAAFSLVAIITSWASYQSPVERDHARDLGHLRVAQAYEGIGRLHQAAQHYECLARFWGSDWDLWVRVVTLYRESGDYDKAYDLAAELIRIHRREPRLFTTLLELGDSLGIPDDARDRILQEYRSVVEEEPAGVHDERDRAFLLDLTRGLGISVRINDR